MRQLFETRDFQETGLQPMADPAGLSAAVLVVELCALGYSYPNIKHYTKKEVFAAFRVVYRGRNGTKNGILGVIWQRRVERGPNQREERTCRALYRRRGRSPRPTGGSAELEHLDRREGLARLRDAGVCEATQLQSRKPEWG